MFVASSCSVCNAPWNEGTDGSSEFISAHVNIACFEIKSASSFDVKLYVPKKPKSI